MVKITTDQWIKIHRQLSNDFPISHTLIRDVMKRELGFTVRKHEEWHDRNVESRDQGYGTKYRTEEIYLDFYDDAKETWFRLRYLNND
jgi:hypothetical protein